MLPAPEAGERFGHGARRALEAEVAPFERERSLDL